jgi:hypothetical protein
VGHVSVSDQRLELTDLPLHADALRTAVSYADALATALRW